MKRKAEAEGGNDKKQKVEGTVLDRIRSVTVPLADKSYEDQLSSKKCDMRKVLQKLTKEIRNVRRDASAEMSRLVKDNEGLICPFPDVVPSPVSDNYRNKCEFTIGQSPALHLHLLCGS